MSALRLIIYSWAVILGLGILLWSQADSRIDHVLPINRWLAGVFILLVIVLSVAECGWGGGKKINASHIGRDYD